MPIPDFDPKRYEQWIDDIRFDIDYANHQINDETENLLTHQGQMIGVTLAKTLPTEDIEHIIEALKPIMRERDTDASMTPIVFGMNSTLITELATRHGKGPYVSNGNNDNDNTNTDTEPALCDLMKTYIEECSITPDDFDADSDFEHVRTQAIVGASLQAFPVETSDKLHELFDDTDTKTLSTAANMLYDIAWNANNGYWVLRILANALSCDFDAQRLSVSLAKPVDQYNILHDDQCADIVANKLFNDMIWLKEKLSHYDTREAIVRQAYREIAKAQDNVAQAYAAINRNIANH